MNYFLRANLNRNLFLFSSKVGISHFFRFLYQCMKVSNKKPAFDMAE